MGTGGLATWRRSRVPIQGCTLEEARENLKEAVRLVIEANRELARQEAGGTDVIREELRIAV